MPQGPVPVGTVTFLFTDIEGSTKLWELHPETMRTSLSRHDEIMRQAISASNGYVFKTMGDAFHAAFATAPAALEAVLASQLAIAAEPWPEETPIRVRMALHTGAVESRDDDYFGPPVNRVARLLSTAHGEQSVVSAVTQELVRDFLPPGVSLKDLGAHQLKDLARPEQIFQLLHPKLRADFPPIRSLSTHPNNLPQQLTNFIGREKETEDLKALLTKNRLVTLIGSGGTGKTRLSLQVAANTLERYSDGAWFVELAPLSDPALVTKTVADALGIKEQAGEPILSTLLNFLKDKTLLILLDNCEHLVASCASLVHEVLQKCSDVQVIASSREALAIPGEQTYRVPSLSLPDPTKAQTAESLSHYESVRLFIDRATLAKSDFQVTNQNAPALASLCYHLDGIPLAIELAAARVRSLSIEDIDSKLDQRFRLLTGGSRTALPRQQTLKALVDWSYDLLSDAEKALLSRLSVFAGGWSLEAAESVCTGDPIEDWEVLDYLTSLCDKSLVVADEQDGTIRYRLLETVRQYATDRLQEAGDSGEWRERHLTFFTELAVEASRNYYSRDQKRWFAKTALEHDNLRAAIDAAIDRPGSESNEVRLCAALSNWWFMCGHFAEGLSRLEHALQASHGAEPILRCKVLIGIGSIKMGQSSATEAEERLAQGLELAESHNLTSEIIESTRKLAGAYAELKNTETRDALLDRALLLAQQFGARRHEALTLNSMGYTLVNRGLIAEGVAMYERSLEILHEEGDLRSSLLVVGNLGGACYALGDFEGCAKHFRDSLEMRRELGDVWGVAGCHLYIGLSEIELGNIASARDHLENGLVIFKRLGNKHDTVCSAIGLARLDLAEGNILGACERAAEGMRFADDSWTNNLLWSEGGFFVQLYLEKGSPLDAVRILGWFAGSEETREESRYDWVKQRLESHFAAARAALRDDAAIDAAWSEGREMGDAQAVGIVLGAIRA